MVFKFHALRDNLAGLWRTVHLTGTLVETQTGEVTLLKYFYYSVKIEPV